MSSERMGRARLFMEIASLYSTRGTCRRARVGAVAVRDGRVVAAGYNGAPAGLSHCLDVGCDLVDGRCVRAVHAEANLVSWAARTGTPLEGTDIYCTTSPCYDCAKMLCNAGIHKFFWREAYHPDDTVLWARLAELTLTMVTWKVYESSEPTS